MYCNKCHKNSPDNFINCAYCGAKFKPEKKKEPHRFVKSEKKHHQVSMRAVFRILIGFGALLIVAATIVSTFFGSKPEKVVKQLVRAIETNDSDAYFSLYDANIVRYKTDNHYFGEDETYKQMIATLEKSIDFYQSECGEDFEISYVIKSDRSLIDTELMQFNTVLEDGFGYIEFPTRVDVLEMEIVAVGDLGEYTSVYEEFWCMKIKGNWYIVDKTILTDYYNFEPTP